jgi:hypothetical protein
MFVKWSTKENNNDNNSNNNNNKLIYITWKRKSHLRQERKQAWKWWIWVVKIAMECLVGDWFCWEKWGILENQDSNW